MALSKKIENLIVKFLNQSADSFELDKLNIWIKEPKNFTLFKSYVETHYVIMLGLNEPDLDKVKQIFLRQVRKEKGVYKIRKVRSLLKYAAIAILFMGMGYYVSKNVFKPEKGVLQLSEKLITLQREDGSIEAIMENGTSVLVDVQGNLLGKQENGKLVYSGNDDVVEELVYNTLNVPYGKKFDVVLSDGTHVYLNSGTTLRYPVRFIKGMEREVYIQGEAFFDVMKDSLSSFRVIDDELTISVLGTEFNVANYKEDGQTDVVLVEGRVHLSLTNDGIESKEGVELKPGYKGTLHSKSQNLSTEIVNTSIYTSWMSGDIVFRNATFNNIIKKLERVYNVEIINNNQEIGNETFNASFETEKETIVQVLDYFDKVYNIEYNVLNNKVIIE